ncbi:Syntenin [Fasciolopsis buskii]|uniref:Syntenin n=1 Tax=Fasciolopsis buskii TaxID=27845 RepID=A0A8E0S006_9TREM|nr:Syntenin [Fasciolopsis buski]
MSLYPTFEDLKVEGILKAQGEALLDSARSGSESYSQMATFMGLSLDNFCYNEKGELVPRSYSQEVTATAPNPALSPKAGALYARNASRAIVENRRSPAEIKPGVRRVVGCKDENGLFGVQLINVDKGVFVSLVKRDSPAALAGLRFGDQILSINDVVVAGMSGTKVMNLIRSAPPNGIELLVRDRPFERTVSIYKNSAGVVGIDLVDGLIKAIHKDSSAARNGVPINHQIVEVNGQNVIGMKDKKLCQLISGIQGMLTLTILPRVMYEHLVKHLRDSTIRKEMDRSMPEV